MFKKLFKKDKDKEKDNKDTKQPQAPQAPPTYDNAYDGRKVTRDEFESLDVLGKGSFAQVVLAKRTTTGQYYAMKVVTKEGLINHKRVNDVFVERNVLTRSNHPFLMKLYWTFQSEHRLYFVMDYMPGGDLDKYMNSQPSKALDPMTAKLYAAEVFLAITYLHEHKVIYRDLKPENILLSANGHCVLADFGLSKDFHREGVLSDESMRANSFVGSPFYVAPDVLKQKEYSSAVDFWSFGILLFRMLCGRAPFSGRTMKEVFDNILFAELRFPSASDHVSPEAKDLIAKLLTKDANRRIKAAEIRSHPFWDGLEWQDVYDLKISPPMWTPLPAPEEMLRMKNCGVAPAPGTGTSVKAGLVANTPANQQGQLNPQQQNLFQGFSCTADSLMQ